MSKEKKMWGGRFTEEPSQILSRMGESISFDKELYKQDIQGSIAHARMLAKIGILSKTELGKIEKGLADVKKEIESGQFTFSEEKEDIHMHIEFRLTELIGDAGKKLHTARSRNDQVSQDVRLYLVQELDGVLNSLLELLGVWIEKAEKSKSIVIPGYTHLQIAQPIRASHYFLAHFWAMVRDLEDFLDARNRASELVLGSGALAGVNYPSDRKSMQKDLNLDRISENSIDAVSQRDHILKFLFSASQFFLHVSRFSEEVILYSSQEFSYFSLPDSLTTGSSIMPQKKNPDVAELLRGKAGRVIGNLNHLLVLMKGTPLAYNRDFQEDKIPLFDTMKQVQLGVVAVKELVKGIQIQTDRTESNLKKGFATATDLADWLVASHGIPFRESHEISGKLVRKCIELGQDLFSISDPDKKAIHEFLVQPGYFEAISLSGSCDKKNTFGGTALKRQNEQIALAKKKWNQLKKTVQKTRSKL